MTLLEKLRNLIHNKNNPSDSMFPGYIKKAKRDGNSEFLIHANSEMEALIIESKLNAYGIPVLKEYDGAGLYSRIITGNAILGAKIYVPSALIEKAKDLIADQGVSDSEI